MKSLLFFGLFAFCLVIFCQKTPDIPKEILQDYPSTFIMSVTNESNLFRDDEVVTLAMSDIKERYDDFNPLALVVFDGATEVPSQVYNVSQEGISDKLAFLVNFGPREEKQITVCYSPSGEKKRLYPARTTKWPQESPRTSS